MEVEGLKPRREPELSTALWTTVEPAPVDDPTVRGFVRIGDRQIPLIASSLVPAGEVWLASPPDSLTRATIVQPQREPWWRRVIRQAKP